MAVQLNHTIVAVRDKNASAIFLAEVLGTADPTPLGPFMCVETANGVSLAYDDREGPVLRAGYAFLVSEDEFDAIFTRIQARLRYWGDPGTPGRERSTTSGVYFADPSAAS